MKLQNSTSRHFNEMAAKTPQFTSVVFSSLLICDTHGLLENYVCNLLSHVRKIRHLQMLRFIYNFFVLEPQDLNSFFSHAKIVHLHKVDI